MKLLIVMMVLLSACTQQNYSETDAQHTISIDLDKPNSAKYLSEVCDTVILINLETSDEALVGEVQKVLMNDDYIYIKSLNKIFIFNHEGCFVSKIDLKGRSRREYMDLDDFCLLDDGSLVLLDGQLKKILFVDVNGKVTKHQEIDFSADAISNITELLFAFSAGATCEHRLIIYDVVKEEVVNKFMPYDERYSIRIFSPLVKCGEEAYFRHVFSSNIYSIDSEGKISTKYAVDFGKYNFSESDLEVNHAFFGMVYDSKGGGSISRFMENSTHIGFYFECSRLSEDIWYTAFYSKESSEISILEYTHTLDDMSYYFIPPQTYGTYNDMFIWVLRPDRWREHIATLDGQEGARYQYIKSVVDRLSDNDNPTIALYRIKP